MKVASRQSRGYTEVRSGTLCELLCDLCDSVVKLYSFKRNPLHEAQGVQEYWIVDAEEEVEPYVLTTTGRKQSYTLQCKGQAGTVQAQAIPGLMLPIEALFDEGAYRQTLSGLRA